MGKGQTMKTSIAIVVTGCCVLGSVWAMAASEQPDSNSSEFEKLKDRVKLLEDRVATLEKERMVIPRVPRTPEMPWQPPGRQAPEGWVPREFNGHRYYVIPIAQDPNGVLPKK